MGQVTETKYTVMAGWDDVPHLDERTKRKLLASTQPYLRDARSKGIPSLGTGAITERQRFAGRGNDILGRRAARAYQSED